VVRRRRKAKEDVYRTSFDRLSSYPSVRNAISRAEAGSSKPRRLAEGDTVKVRITGVDDDGRPTGDYKGYKVVIDGVDVEPGVEVEVRITRVRGRVAYAEPLGGA